MTNDISQFESRMNEVNVLGLNIRSLGFHHDQLKILLETLERKPEIVILPETWLTENDPLDELDLDEYQPIESKPREFFKRRSGGVAFYVKEGIKYSNIDFQTEIECSIIQLTFPENVVKNFCAIYRPETLRLTKFFAEFEALLYFLKTIKSESILFGDFNIDTLVEHKTKTDYINLLTAYDFQVSNSLPTRVTPISKTCIDHMITERMVTTETIQTTISDHFTVTAKIPANWKECTNMNIPLVRNLKKNKRRQCAKFPILSGSET